MKAKTPTEPYRPRRPDSHLISNKKKTLGSTIYNADLRENQQKRQAGILKFYKDTPLQKFRQLRKKFYTLTNIYTKYTHHSSINQKSLNNINELDIIEGKWDEMKVRDLFDSIYEADLIILRLYENMNPEIPEVISKISFPELKKLYLDSNNITSIEILLNWDIAQPYMQCSTSSKYLLHQLKSAQLLGHKLMYLHLMDYEYPGKNASIDMCQLLKMSSIQFKKISLDNRYYVRLSYMKQKFCKKFPLIEFGD